MSEILKAIKQICEEKGLSYEAVIETVESALAAAYRKDYGKKNQNIKVEFDPETGKSKVYDVKIVVEDMPEEEIVEEGEEEVEQATEESVEGEEGEEKRRFNPKTEIQITEAKALKKTAKIGDEIKTKLEVPESYGRMAAQTAKQVIIQRLREAEREMVFNDFKDKEHEVVGGIIQRREGRMVLVDLGKSVGVLPPEEQIIGERYNTGDRIKVYVKEVTSRTKGPEIVLSRTSDEILKKVFYLEIPEISNGLIEIKGVAREAGSRSKVAVWTDSDNVDPIGSCVGQRGSRIQTIIQELGGEKVDIIAYDDDPIKYISNALSPAKIINININDAEKKATVVVSSEQLSLAIGKSGQNARLAARLTGWKIDIVEKASEKKEEEPSILPEALSEINETSDEVLVENLEAVEESKSESIVEESENKKEVDKKAKKKVQK